MAESGEPAVPGAEWMFAHSAGTQPYTVPETWKLNGQREAFRQRGLAHWNATKSRSSTGRPVDAIICPTSPCLAVPHEETRWWGYTSHWNLLDLPGMVFPVGGRFDPALPDAEGDRMKTPRNEAERHYAQMWEEGREDFKGAPITLQMIGRRLNEEKVLAMLGVVEGALDAMPSE